MSRQVSLFSAGKYGVFVGRLDPRESPARVKPAPRFVLSA
jgi:hypothetical protein